eukprot:4702-Heterococcus_DN1.PRE.4
MRAALSRNGSAEPEQRWPHLQQSVAASSSSSTYSRNDRVKSKADTLAAISAFSECDIASPGKFVMTQRRYTGCSTSASRTVIRRSNGLD